MLAFNVGEWARLAKEDTGKDQEGRRQKISQVIDKEGFSMPAPPQKQKCDSIGAPAENRPTPDNN